MFMFSCLEEGIEGGRSRENGSSAHDYNTRNISETAIYA